MTPPESAIFFIKELIGMSRPPGSRNKPKDGIEVKAQKTYSYWDFGEIMSPEDTGKLLRVSTYTVYGFIRTGIIPGIKKHLEYGVHYFKSGSDYKIVKDPLCQLVGILPKSPNGVTISEQGAMSPVSANQLLLTGILTLLQGLNGGLPDQAKGPDRAGGGGLRLV